MRYLNDKEEKIIGTFMYNMDDYYNCTVTLKWKDGSWVIAEFDACSEDDNDLELDDENYEELTSFVFKALWVKDNPPVYITEDAFFLVDYRNFPDEIIAGGKKIN